MSKGARAQCPLQGHGCDSKEAYEDADVARLMSKQCFNAYLSNRLRMFEMQRVKEINEEKKKQLELEKKKLAQMTERQVFLLLLSFLFFAYPG